MITVSNLGMQFGGQWLFQHVFQIVLPRALNDDLVVHI